MLKVFISGQKYFAQEVLSLCINDPEIEVVGVCCSMGDRYIGKMASIFEIPIIPSGLLNGDTFPENIDLGIAAHSFDYIGKRTRYKAKIGWIGYHPSLLPRHRGRSSIEWAIRMRDCVTGGTIYWLNSGIDRGDIMDQDWCFIHPELFAMNPRDAARRLWQDVLCRMGVRLMDNALHLIKSGIYRRSPQMDSFSTWEPSTDVNDIYRPDALMLPEPQYIEDERGTRILLQEGR